jgi:hypothetical protein
LARPPAATVTDLRKFVDFVDQHPEFRPSATPIFCLHLDPKLVPTVEPDTLLDNPLARLRPAFALTAFKGLSGIAVADENEARILLPHITDICTWVVFVINHFILPKDAHRKAELKISLRPLSDVLRPISVICPEIDPLGLNLVRPVADLWILSCHSAKIRSLCRQGWKYNTITALWAGIVSSRQDSLAEFLTALVDSDVECFASTAITQLSRTLSSLDGTPTAYYDLANDIDILYFLSVCGPPSQSEIAKTLVERGAMTFICKAALSLSQGILLAMYAHHIIGGITRAAGFVNVNSCVAPGRPWVIQAIRSGIIEAMLHSARWVPCVKISEVVGDYLSAVKNAINRLSAYLIYRSVVRVALKAIENVEEHHLLNSGPKTLDLGKAWESFKELAFERDIIYCAARTRVIVECRTVSSIQST